MKTPEHESSQNLGVSKIFQKLRKTSTPEGRYPGFPCEGGAPTHPSGDVQHIIVTSVLIDLLKNLSLKLREIYGPWGGGGVRKDVVDNAI